MEEKKNIVLDEFLWFIDERESIRKLKEYESPWPWTTDEILQTERFCNIDRMHDKGTIQLFKNLGSEIFKEEDQVAQICVYRTASSGNQVLTQIRGLRLKEIFEYLETKKFPIHIGGNQPYQFAPGKKLGVKEYLLTILLPCVPEIVELCNNYSKQKLIDVMDDLINLVGYFQKQKFQFHQIALDLGELFPGIDKNSECHLGPGALGGLNFIYPGEHLKDKVLELVGKTGLNYQIVEHALCEFNKYKSFQDGSKPRGSRLYPRPQPTLF